MFARNVLRGCVCRSVRYGATLADTAASRDASRTDAWQIHGYGEIEELQLGRVRTPIIRQPKDVLIQVEAASVNPIDLAMIRGYGSTAFNFLRTAENFSLQSDIEFPITLGRDFAGEVVDLGHDAMREFSVGDKVWGVVPIHQQGSHARKVVVNKCLVHKKPPNISPIEAGSMLYAALTAWSALKITGGLAVLPARGKKVLVLGASGGVGCMAVQLLNSWGAEVVATCSTSAVPLVESLGVSNIIDYTRDDGDEQIVRGGKYDIILDCAGLGENGTKKYSQLLKEFNFAKIVTLSSPLLKNMDEFGIVGGVLRCAADLVKSNLNTIPKGGTVRWGFFIPAPGALEEITHQVQRGKLQPCIGTVYKFHQLPEAYKRVSDGHLRGKVVVDFT